MLAGIKGGKEFGCKVAMLGLSVIPNAGLSRQQGWTGQRKETARGINLMGVGLFTECSTTEADQQGGFTVK